MSRRHRKLKYLILPLALIVGWLLADKAWREHTSEQAYELKPLQILPPQASPTPVAKWPISPQIHHLTLDGISFGMSQGEVRAAIKSLTPEQAANLQISQDLRVLRYSDGERIVNLKTGKSVSVGDHYDRLREVLGKPANLGYGCGDSPFSSWHYLVDDGVLIAKVISDGSNSGFEIPEERRGRVDELSLLRREMCSHIR